LASTRTETPEDEPSDEVDVDLDDLPAPPPLEPMGATAADDAPSGDAMLEGGQGSSSDSADGWPDPSQRQELPAVADREDPSYRRQPALGRRFQGEDEEVGSELDAALDGIRTDVGEDPMARFSSAWESTRGAEASDRSEDDLDAALDTLGEADGPSEPLVPHPARLETDAEAGNPPSDAASEPQEAPKEAQDDLQLDDILADIQRDHAESSGASGSPGRAMEFDLKEHAPPGGKAAGPKEDAASEGGDAAVKDAGGPESSPAPKAGGEEEPMPPEEPDDGKPRKSGFFKRLFGR
jgi:hypothetical protein